MYVKKFPRFLSSIKRDAHKRKLVPFFCLTAYRPTLSQPTEHAFKRNRSFARINYADC